MAEENRIHEILANLSSAASVAADGVSDAVQNASSVVSSKYDSLKMNIELNRLQDEQDDIFADIGRTMFRLQSGKIVSGSEEQEELINTQQKVDLLLLQADQKQQEIDLIAERIFKNSGSVVCENCGKICTSKDEYCGRCGTKLPKKN